MVSRADIEAFLTGKSIVYLGASRSPGKFGAQVYKALRGQGFDVALVHPVADAIQGERCHRSIAEAAAGRENALIVLGKEKIPAVLREAAAAGIRRVWIQQGSESPETLALAASLGLQTVHGQCILLHAAPTGPHAIHRFFAKLFRRLPA